MAERKEIVYTLPADMTQGFYKTLIDTFAAADLTVSDEAAAKFYGFYRELIAWNTVMNLTGITEEAEVIEKHFLDSVLALKYIENPTGRLIDVGTGAGFPGLPLHFMAGGFDVHLLDSLKKRITFLEHVKNTLSLTDLKLHWGRAEESARDKALRGQFDLSVSRAVAPLPILLEYTLPFLKVGGIMVAQKGPALRDEVKDSKRALQLLKGEIIRVEETVLPVSRETRTFLWVRKIAATPPAYPRKAGTPSKQPL